MPNKLSDRDYESMSQIIYRVNSTSGYEKAALEILKQLKYIIPYDKGSIFQIKESETGAFYYQNPISVNSAGISVDEKKFMDGDYYSDCLIYISSPWSNTFRSNDVRDEREFVSSRLYKEVYLPQNIHYNLASILVHNDQRVAIIGLFRSKDKSDFTDRELYILKSLAPHMELKLYTEIYSDQNRNPDRFLAYRNEFSQEYMAKYKLTKREAEVLQMLCRGFDNNAISEQFGISISTLNKHLNSLYKKTSAKNRVQLIRQYMDEVSVYILNQ